MSEILSKLSPEEKKQVMEAAKEELKNQDAKEKDERKMYKEIASNEVANHVARMKETVEIMKTVKI